MNCERVNRLLDTKSAAELTAAERRAVDQHLASCDECREAWKAYRELAALRIPATPQHLRVRIATAYRELAAPPIPATPQHLRVRIATALATRAVERLHARRGFFIGVVLLAGAAVAATAVLHFKNRSVDPAPDPALAIEAVARVVQPVAPPEPPEPESSVLSDDPVPSPRGADEPSAVADTLTYPLDPFSILVVSLIEPDADAETTAALAGCHDAAVEQLRRVVGLNVIAGERLKPRSGSALPEVEIARGLGAGKVLVLFSVNRQPRCGCEWHNLETGGGGGAVEAIDVRPPESWSRFGAELARQVQEATFKDAGTRLAEARATLLNTGLGDRERLRAVSGLRQGTAPPVHDEATIAAVVQIGMTSRDADVRATAWSELRGATDPHIVPPLLYAVENDVAEEVRQAAALTLAPFTDQRAVRDALTYAAAEVPSGTPKVSCCASTVRAAARLALRAGDEPTEAVRRTVLDESLTPQERLVLQRPDGRFTGLDQLGDEAARAVFEIGSSADDDEVRSRAWKMLGEVSADDFVPALLEDLARHPAETVRAAAAAGLRRHRDNPAVRAALERAQADSSVLVQRGARNALDGVRVAY